MEDPGYTCKECGLVVIVTREGEIIRACPHDNATVIATMKGTVYGESKVENDGTK
jgi:hypothetical protein